MLITTEPTVSPRLRLLRGLIFLLAPLLAAGFYSAHAAGAAVEMSGLKYTRARVEIPTGGSVTWVNRDPEPHNIAITEGPALNVSPELRDGQSWTMTFDQPGLYHYYCEYHPWMVADVVVGGSTSTVPTDRAAQTFAETGKSVRGAFLSYWNAHGGLTQQGFPISEEITESSDTDGKLYTVQYFERAVFEQHPENKAPNDVLLSLLGNFLYQQKYPNGAPNQQANTSTGSVIFPETGKRLGGRFLAYWQAHGGLAQQGFPISNEFREKNDLDGKTYLVQYFERAVFEYHPENQPPFEVLLSQLGRFRYDKVHATAPLVARSGVTQIGVSAGPDHYPLLAGPHAAPGVNVQIYQNDPAPVVTWLDEMGSKWALHQLSWYQIETEKGIYHWEKIDAAVDALYRAGVNIILHPVHSPPWAWGGGDKVTYPSDPADYGRFVKLAAQRYKGKVVAYQIWNEPNLAIEAGKYVVAARYAAILKEGYRAVKAADPNAVVITAALTPNGVNDPYKAVDDVLFLRRLYAYNGGELKGYFDVLGAHPGSNANPPEALWPDKPGPGPGWTNHQSFYFRRIEQLHQVMIENGDAQKQIWLTEFGWSSTTTPAAGFEYAAQNSEQEQADYIGRAFRMSRANYTWMGPMLVFQLNMALPNIATDSSDERIAWGLLRRDGSKRPSYFAFQQYAREYAQQK